MKLYPLRNRIVSACFLYDLKPDQLRSAVADLRDARGGLESWVVPALEFSYAAVRESNPEMLKVIPELLASCRGLPVARQWQRVRAQYFINEGISPPELPGDTRPVTTQPLPDWDPIRELANRVIRDGEPLLLTSEVTGVIRRAAREVAIPDEEIGPALRAVRTAKALLRKVANRIANGSNRLMDATLKTYQLRDAGDLDTARKVMRDLLAIEVIPHHRDIIEAELARLADGKAGKGKPRKPTARKSSKPRKTQPRKAAPRKP